jgi:hypothetical protein
LRGWLAGFEIDDKPNANASRSGKLILPQLLGLAGSPDDHADFGRCHGAIRHSSRAGK